MKLERVERAEMMYVADMQESQISIHSPGWCFQPAWQPINVTLAREQLLGYHIGEAEESLRRCASHETCIQPRNYPGPTDTKGET
jgi:hypothetical protein